MTLRQSIFQAREMLLDYHENKLDAARHEFVKKVLASDVETERALNQIKKGLDFAKGLSQVRINENFVTQLNQAESLPSIVIHYSRFKNWSQAFRTSTYAILSCVMVVMLVMSLPKGLLLKLKHKSSSDSEVVLSQLPKGTDPNADSEDPEKRDAQAALAENLPTDTDEDEGGDDQSGGEASGDEHAERIKISPSLNAKIAATKVNPKVASEGEEASQRNVEENKDDGEKDARQSKGFVYRGTMKIDDLDERSPLIAQQILDLGGRKAGEVELGWKKENKGSYYHFSMPEENYDKLLEYLHGFGPVRFSKDSHPRVMPAGQIRIILWVERNQNE